MLKCIHRRDPTQHTDDAFQMRAPRTLSRQAHKLLNEFVTEQLHTHRGDFAKLDRRAAIREQVSLRVASARGRRGPPRGGWSPHHAAAQRRSLKMNGRRASF